MKRLIYYALLAWLLVACAGAEPEPTVATTAALPGNALPEVAVAGPTNTAAPMPTAAPTATNAPDGIPADAAAPEESPAAAPSPTPTTGAQVNGNYENTYFRGSAGAPVTLIDYSDFL
ncbi:MAG: hypothetical protein L0332_36295 [Chloroflexi bacterium]|nr:hypothetical protein [Chloroflexota bacterium]MCI0578375.1 hypothetical protein [Chloroflexota bacterium]MCI0645391.1 hypothetical protein [Chloroflexota bacterium]MCI0732158.1 hypothetical protein [Chloroflexota bacterium]